MSATSRVHFLINPRSGRAKARQLIEYLRNLAANSGHTLSVDAIDFPRLAEQIEQARTAGTVVIGGGDGTVSHLLGRFRGHPRIGILPLGTGNDLARELRISPSIRMRPRGGSNRSSSVTLPSLGAGSSGCTGAITLA